MDSHDDIKFWLPLIGSTIFIVLLSTVPLPLLLLIPVLAAMAYVMQEQIFYTRSLSRQFWLSTYLRPDSPIRMWLAKSVLLRWIAISVSLVLAMVTYIPIFGYDLWDCCAVSVAIYVAQVVHKQISAPIDSNLAKHLVELAHLRVYYWLAISFVLLTLASSSIVKGMFVDYSKATSDQIATETINALKHPVRLVQHCVRTLRYSELELLRIRDINGWPWGWLIYFFFLVPNALPAFGLVTLYAGGERTVRKWARS